MIFGALLLAALDLGSLFAKSEAWTDKAEFFAVEHAKDGFRFASENRDIVNCLDHDSCVWYGHKVWETKVYFDKLGEEETISRVELSLFNTGDANGEALDLDTLKKLLADISTRFQSGVKKFKDEKTVQKNNSMQYRRVFDKGMPVGELVWGLSAPDGDNRRSVDFVRLSLQKAEKKISAKTARGTAAKAKVKENVSKSPNGDVFIENVPMVDQGQKGYCAAAVAERVLRYYGLLIDEHEVAQQAGTTAEGGTSIAVMKKVVMAIGEKNSLGFSEIVSMSAHGVAGLEEELVKYNKAAKLEKKSELTLAEFTSGNMIDVGAMYEAMEAKVIYRMRRKDSRAKKFSSGIRQQINAGVPVFWGVTLGIFPERGLPQTRGGHMRLIIGYNDKKKEILYTDTWGEGHELKRMPEDWAFTITNEAFLLKPR